MLDFYFHPTPNGTKVALLLEELQLPYALKLIDILKGEQHDASYQKINPNGKVPAIVDDGITIFDSHAILLHLAEKHGKFMPSEASARCSTVLAAVCRHRSVTVLRSSRTLLALLTGAGAVCAQSIS
jgi:GST-like protein